MRKLSPSDKEMQKWQKTISVFELRLQYITSKTRAGWFQQPPHLTLVHPLLSPPWIWRAALQVVICSPYPRQPFPSSHYQLVPGESCLRAHLGLRTSGGLKSLPCAGRALPGRSEKGLSCLCSTWSIKNGIWDQLSGEGEQKNTVDVEGERVLLSAAQYPALEQLPLRVMASISQSRSRVAVLSKIYSTNLFINAVRHFSSCSRFFSLSAGFLTNYSITSKEATSLLKAFDRNGLELFLPWLNNTT